MLSRNKVALLLSASTVLTHIHSFTTTSTTRRSRISSSSLFYKDVNKDDEIYTFPNNLDLPEMSHNWKPEMPSYPQGISPFDVFEESLGQETNQSDQPSMYDISSSLPKPLFEEEKDGHDQHIKALSFAESSEKKAKSKTNIYKRGVQKYKTTQLKRDETSRHLSSNVSWLPATLATSNANANSLMEHVQTKPVSFASLSKISSNSSTSLQSDEAVQQSTMKRFSIKNISSISDYIEKFNEKVIKNVKESQKAFTPKLDSMISQRKIVLLQMASILHETVRRWKRIATKELVQATARIHALISNMDILSYRLPRLNISLTRKSKKHANTSIAAIPTASASSKYLSSLRVSITTSTFEKPSIATIRYIDVLPSKHDFDIVAF